MSYANFDHAGWMEAHLASTRRRGAKVPEKLSDFQKKVVGIVGIIGSGIYNAPINPDKIEWDHGRGVSMVWMREMATWDFNQLTWLVFLCHEARIRCSVEGCGPRNLRLSFWPREAEGQMSVRHPDLGEAVKIFRQWFTSSHPINYEPVPVPTEIVCHGTLPNAVVPHGTKDV